ncbi:FkbM family methyltransferase, partial [Cellulomonas septica]
RATAARPAVSAALELLGAHTLADRADRRRSGGEIVPVTLPAPPGAWRAHRIKALRQGGTDQWVEAFRQGGWWGYERPLPDVLLGAVRRRPGVVVDVGANTGVYSLLAASTRGTTVHAFEPYPPVAAMLRENVRLNAFRGRVRVVEAAVTDVEGTVDLWVPPAIGVVETSCSTDPGFKGGEQERVEVRALTLDSYWRSIGSPPVSVVKIDVEGAEVRTLRGGRSLLAEARPWLLVEILEHAPFDELEDERRAAGYVDVRLSPWEAVVGDRLRFHPLAWNHAWVPSEDVDDAAAVFRAAGLVVTETRR